MDEGGLGGYDEPATTVYVYNAPLYNLGMTALRLCATKGSHIPPIHTAPAFAHCRPNNHHIVAPNNHHIVPQLLRTHN